MTKSYKHPQLDNPVIVGKFGAPHGVRGAVKLFSYTEYPEDIFNYKLYCQGKDAPITLKLQSAAADFFIVSEKNIKNREQASALTHMTLSIERTDMPDINDEEGTYYHHDLIGCTAVCAGTGKTLGSVHAMHNFGAGDIIEIKPVSKGDSYMLPFNDDVVPNIDTTTRTVTVAHPYTYDSDKTDTEEECASLS